MVKLKVRQGLFKALILMNAIALLHQSSQGQDTTAFLTSSTTSICLGDTATLNAGTVGADYGDGSDGALTVSSGTAYTDAVITGVTGTNAAGGNTLTVASSSGFAVGDEIIIITMVDAATSGNTVGQHEFNKITAISGNTLTLAAIRAFAFNASSTQIHQAIKVPNYTNVSISSGATLTCAAWDGSTGGVLCFRANGTLTNSGTITAVGKGYRGVGHTAFWRNKDGAQGEGIYGTGYAGGNSSGSNNVTWNGANGNGGGGGTGRQDSGGGAGGGYASNGTNGNNYGGHFGGTGGLSVGTANLDLLIMGGAGGEGGGDEDGALAGSGGNGGGIIYISASITQNAGTITCNGNNGGNGTNSGGGRGCGMGGGGGGAGGSIKLISVFDGTGTITSIGGNGGTNNGCGGAGGAGSVGRIALASTISSYPTTNPVSATASLTVITGSSFAWSNGDTSSFIQVSPTTTTTYTVTITNGTWADTLSNEIYVFGVPNMPTALADIEHCAGTFTFNATTDSLVQTVWYDSPTGGTPIFHGNEFTTPFLNDTTTYYFRSQYVTYTPPADAVDNSMQLALGLRLLVSDYEGKAVILRKSATANDTASFGFNFLGQLDADAINAWAGSATDLWVHTIFDQSGNGRNLLNTTTGQQPKLILSGENGKPVLRFVTGTFLRYTTNDIVYPMSIVTAAKLTTNSCGRVFGAANNYIFAFYSNQVNRHHFNTWISNSGTNMVPASSSDTWIHSSMSASNTSHRFFDNGNEWPANTINNANSQPPNGFQLNGYAANNETSNVDIMEVFIFNDVITDTEREYIEGRIASQYDWQTAGGQVVDAAAPCLLSNPNIDSVTAIVTAPSFGITLDTITVNCGADSILIDAGSGWQTYSWSNLDTTQICTARYSGKYKIVVNDGSCDVTDSVFVSLPKPVLDDFTICNGDTITAGYLNLGGFASGGILDTIGQEAVNKFLTDGTLVFPSTTQVRALIVGGGGGGGMDMGGGGGAGGFIDTTFILPAGTYNINVGQGGSGAPAAGTFGQPTGHQYSIPALNGGNSSIESLLTAIGGGAGGTSYWNSTPGAAGSNGGSGGGCAGYNAPNGSGAGLGTAGQGNRGGHGGGSHYSGGGGGAGSEGGGGPNGGTYNANGGDGLPSDILGTTYYFAGGGGGSGYSVVGGNGGIGGGGGGAVGTTTGGAGLNNGLPGGGGNINSQTNKPGGNAGANTGGGGGGGSHFNSNNKGGEGGSGIVVIRYTPILNYQFLWSTGDTTATINVSPTQTTDYYVTITDGVSVCYDTMTVFVNAPVHSFSSDTITYCGVDTATLDAGTGWSNYAWSTGDSTQLFTTTKGGVYHLTVTNQYGCTMSDSVSVGVINTTLEQGDTTICVGETATLTVSPNGVSTEHALAFDGNGDFVISPYNASFNVSSVTIEAWVYSSNFSQNGFIFEKGAVNTQYSLFFEGGTLKFRNGGATFAINSASAGFTNNAWHHVAATYDGAQKKIYVDGALAGTQNYTGTFATNTQGTIIGAYGAAGVNSYFFNGKIDEVRVWNLARTATEIAESYNTTLSPNTTGLIGYWPMEEGSGNVIENLVTQTSSNAFAGNTAFVSSGAPISGPNSLSYSWSNGDTTNTIDVSPNSTTTYYVTITDGIGSCIDSVTVTVNNPTFNFAQDTITCVTDSEILDAGAGWASYTWSSGETTQTISVNTSGTYTVTVTNANSCTAIDSVMIESVIIKETITANPAQLCDGSSTTITTNSSEIGLKYTLYDTSNNIIGVPVSGTGSALSFNTGNLSASNNYYVEADASNNALAFDGVNDYVVLDDVTASVTSLQYTIEFWMNGLTADNTGGNGGKQMFSVHNATGTQNKIRIGLCGSCGGVLDLNDQPTNGSAIIGDGNWHHIALVSNGTVSTVYVDGVLDLTQTTSATWTASDLASLGQEWDGSTPSDFFEGKIDDVRIWNLQRTPTEIAQNMNTSYTGSETGLVGYYNFNVGSGSTLPDLTVNNNDGVLTNMDTNTAWVSGQGSNASVICAVNSDTVSVTVNSNPTFAFIQDTILSCGADSVIVDAGAGWASYAWSNSATTQTTSLTALGSYTVTVTDANACTATDNVTLTAITDQALTAGSAEFCAGNGTTITTNSSELGVNYTLYEATNNTLADGPTPGTGNSLTLQTGNLTTSTDFYLKASLGDTLAQGTGEAISFNGTNQYATLPININTSTYPELTITAWVKRTAATTGYHHVISNDNGSWDRGIVIRTDNKYHIYAGRDINTNIISTLNQWEHIAVYYSNSEIKFYLNGQLVFSTTGQGNISGHNAVRIGGRPEKSLYFNGLIDEVTFWNRSLTESEIDGYRKMCDLSSIPGLVGHFRIEEGSGSSIINEASNLSTGTLFNSPSRVTGLSCSNEGCTIQSATNTAIVVNPNPIVSATATDISCNGLSDGSAIASSSGGTSPYTFAWNTSATTASITGVSAGTYTVTVSDSNSCISTSNATITEPTALVASSVISTNISCNGDTDGQVNASATGGTSPYTYSWNTGGTSATETGLSAGTYSVTITDQNGCTDSASVTMSEPSVLVASAAVSSAINCNGGTDGQVNASVTGGTSPYTYSWNTGGTSATETGLGAGTYSVTITDQNGCTDSASVTLADPALVTFNFAQDTILSCGVDSMLVDAGTGWASYAWSNGSTNQILDVTTSGTYNLTVSDANGCTASDSVVVSVINGQIVQNDTTICSGQTLKLSTTDSFTNNNSMTFDGNGDFVLVPYDNSFNVNTLTIESWVYTGNLNRDQGIFEKGNINTQYVLFYNIGSVLKFRTVHPSGTNTMSVSSTGIGLTPNNWHHIAATYDGANKKIYVDGVLKSTYACTGAINTSTVGSIIGAIGGGTAHGNYYWDGKLDEVRVWNVARSASEIASTYNKSVSAASNGLIGYWNFEEGSGSNTINLVDNQFASLNGNATFNNTPSPVSVTSNLTYNWSTSATTASINVTPISTTTYYVTTTNGISSCIDSVTVTVSSPSFSFAQDSIAVCGQDSLTLDAGAGWASYVWSNSATTQTTSITTSGTYTVTVTDANGCTAADNVVVNISSPIVVSFAPSGVCWGDTALLAIENSEIGTDYYLYFGQGSTIISGPYSGNDSTISIQYGPMTADTTFKIFAQNSTCEIFLTDQPTILVNPLPVITTHNDTNMGPTDTIQIWASGGSTYAWSDGQTGDTISISPDTNLVYFVTVTTAKGCQAIDSINILLNTPPELSDSYLLFNENSLANSTVGSIIATDTDTADILSYTLIGGDTNNYSITTGGLLLFDNNFTLDYETNRFDTVYVRVDDDGSPSLGDEAMVVIEVQDINEKPILVADTFLIDENSINGLIAGTLVAIDIDTITTFTYSIIGGADSVFAINGSTGEISVSDSSNLDVETTPTFELVVEVADGGLVADLYDTATYIINLNDINEKPFIAEFTNNINENSAQGTLLTTVAAADQDTLQDFRYFTFAGDVSAIGIDSLTGAVTIIDSAQFNREAITVLSVDVVVFDGGLSPELTDTATITINIDDINEKPILATDTFLIDENSINSLVAGTSVAFDVDTITTFTYNIIGGADSVFAINASTGEISVSDSSYLDAETQSTFNVIVEVTDGGLISYLLDTATYVINLNDVNEKPILTADTFLIDENSINGLTAGITITSDVDTLTNYSFSIIGGADSVFAINATTGEISVSDSSYLDVETIPTFELVVEVADGGLVADLFDTTTYIINLNDLNEKPFIADFTNSINENSAQGTLLTNLTAADQDTLQDFKYFTFAGDVSAIVIDSLTGAVTIIDSAQFNREAITVLSVDVVVFDGGLTPELTDTATITINIIDINEKPISVVDTFNVNEDAIFLTPIGFATAIDVDTTTTFNYFTIGGADSVFGVDQFTGELSVIQPQYLNFENINQYHLLVQVLDGGLGFNLLDTATLVVNVNDINEKPILLADTFYVNENSNNGFIIDSIFTFDVDAQQVFTYNIIGGADSVFALNDSSGALSIIDSSKVNFEEYSYFEITVVVEDGGLVLPLKDTLTYAINVIDQNEKPVMLPDTFVLAENSSNGTFVGKVNIIDNDSTSNLRYDLFLGNSVFAIDSVTGEFFVADSSQISAETFTFFNVSIAVSDGPNPSLRDTGFYMVYIDDVNEKPTLLPKQLSVNENSVVGTVVDTISAFDVDTLQLFTYSFIGGADSAFTINSATGEILVSNGFYLNYEDLAIQEVVVQVSDGGLDSNLFDTLTYAISIENVNEKPVAFDSTVFILENTLNNTVVTTQTPFDVDSNSTFNYSIIGGADTVFAIDASGNISLIDSSKNNFETNTNFVITVEVSDNDIPQLLDTAFITFIVEDVNEKPILAADTFLIDENSNNGAFVGQATAFDVDATTNFKYQIIAGNDTAFAIDSASGIITIADNSYLDYETDTAFLLTIKLFDGGSKTLTQLNGGFSPELFDTNFVLISLNNINEAPQILFIQNDTICALETTALTAFQIFDFDSFDPNSTLILSASSSDTNLVSADSVILSGTDSNRFVQITPISKASGLVNITITVSDTSGLSTSSSFSLRVLPLPNVIASQDKTICNEQSATISVVGGQSFAWSNSFTGSIQTVSPSVTTDYIVTSTGGNGCTKNDTVTVFVNQLPNVNLPAFGDLCKNVLPDTLNTGTPAGGVYSGIGIFNNIFYPNQAGLGVKPVFYTYTDSNGCVAGDTSSIRVLNAPNVNLAGFGFICTGDSAITLNQGTPANGTYIGTGVTNNTFNPQSTGVGVYNITYRVVNANGCPAQITKAITVNKTDTASFAVALPDVCENVSTINLAFAMPAGGDYNGGSYIDSTGVFNPITAGAGVHLIDYSYTNAAGCVSVISDSIVVNPKPNVTLSAIPSVCSNISPFALTGGLPSNGFYQGPGVNNGNFNPLNSGSGTFNISYNFVDSNNCVSADTQQVVVYAPTKASIVNINGFCENIDTVAIAANGTPSGGYFTGSGVVDSIFYLPSLISSSITSLTYNFIDTNGCFNTASKTIVIYNTDSVNLSPFAPVCENNNRYALNGGFPKGGLFSGPGVDSLGFFNPKQLGNGNYNLNYTFTNVNGCFETQTQSITVKPIPNVLLNNIPALCESSDPLTLSQGLPSGGNYTGSGVISGILYPAITGVGIDSVTYTYLDTNGCSNFAKRAIQINVAPLAVASNDTSICFGETINLNASGGLSYQWSNGDTGSVVSISPTATTLYSVIMTNNIGCTDEELVKVTVHPGMNLTYSAFDANCNQANGIATVIVNGGKGPFGYNWTTGNTSSLANNLSSGVYSVTVSDVFGCEKVGAVSISDKGAPKVTLVSQIDPLCYNSPDGELEIAISKAKAQYYSVWNNGDTGTAIQNLTAGTYDVVVADENGCSTFKSYTLVNPDSISIDFVAVDASCGNSDGKLFATVSGGTQPYTYNWQTGGSTADSLVNISAGVYELEVTDTNNCVISKPVALNNFGAFSLSIDSIFYPDCGQNNGYISVQSSSSDTSITYAWSNSGTNNAINNLGVGVYNVTATDSTGCVAVLSVNLPNRNLITPQICVASVDTALNKVIVVWNETATPDAQSYTLYTETKPGGGYVKLAQIAAGQGGTYIDSVSNVDKNPHRYTIVGNYGCGNSKISTPHNNMVLTYAKDQLGVSLQWNKYIGVDIENYRINRYTPTSGWVAYDTVSASVNKYEDLALPSPIPGEFYYYVEAITQNDCNIKVANSNLTQNLGNVGIYVNELEADNHNFEVFPNPSQGNINLSLKLNKTSLVEVRIYNLQGQIVEYFNLGEMAGTIKEPLELRHISTGAYFIEVETSEFVEKTPLIIQ